MDRSGWQLSNNPALLQIGNTKLWSRDVADSDRSTSVWNDPVLDGIENFLSRTADVDSEKIWGVEMLNQINGLKIVLAAQSPAKPVPISYIAEYFQFTSSPDMIVCQVNHDSWLDRYDSFSHSVIQNVTTAFENRLLNTH